MHPKQFFDTNPFREAGKGGRSRSEEKERSRSAPSDKKPFKYSSPSKSVCCGFSFEEKIQTKNIYSIFVLFYRLVEIKMVASINFQNVVKKIHMLSPQCLLKLKMKLIKMGKPFFQISILNHVRVNQF
jgi:hypothetical protein